MLIIGTYDSSSFPAAQQPIYSTVGSTYHLQINWPVSLQWIPSHVGIAGDERADDLAKSGALMPLPNAQVSLTAAKHLIDVVIKHYIKQNHKGAQWMCIKRYRLLFHAGGFMAKKY